MLPVYYVSYSPLSSCVSAQPFPAAAIDISFMKFVRMPLMCVPHCRASFTLPLSVCSHLPVLFNPPTANRTLVSLRPFLLPPLFLQLEASRGERMWCFSSPPADTSPRSFDKASYRCQVQCFVLCSHSFCTWGRLQVGNCIRRRNKPVIERDQHWIKILYLISTSAWGFLFPTQI